MSQYIPSPPTGQDEASRYTFLELQDLARALQESQPFALLQTLNVAPLKPREGMIAKADGTNWDPGAGAGIYGYINGGWVALHTGGAGSGANLSWTAATRTVASDTGSDAVITLVTSANAGLTPASGGDASLYLKADNTWKPLILENRTSDPSSPAIGQMWLRTDL